MDDQIKLGNKSTDFFFFFKKNFDNFRKFLTSGSIQTVIIINLNDTCSLQGQICVCGHSALETHF